MKPFSYLLPLLLCGLLSTANAQEVPPGQTIGGKFLDVRSPNSVGWRRVGKDPNVIAFARQGAESSDSVVASASLFALPPTKDADELVAIIRRGVEQDNPPERFNTIEAKFEYSEERGYPCVRFRGLSEDKHAKTGFFSHEKLNLQMHALYCRHPDQPTIGFVASYSYRGKALDPNLDADGAAFIQGVSVPLPKPAQVTQAIPPETATPANPADSCAVYVYRNKTSFHRLNPEKPYLYVGDEKIGTLAIGQSRCLHLDPGKYVISVKEPVMFMPAYTSGRVEVEVTGGAKIYVRYGREFAGVAIAGTTAMATAKTTLQLASEEQWRDRQ